MRRRLHRCLPFFACALACLATAAVAQGGERPTHLVKAGHAPPGDGTIGASASQALRRGYLVPDVGLYRREKAAAARHAGIATNAGQPPALAAASPSVIRSWQGINDTFTAPPDSTGAVGSTRFIELVNTSIGIYGKAGNTPLFRGSLQTLASQPGNFVGDPQMMWDPTTNRFYYAMFDVASSSDNRLAIGWSKTASPANATSDWCHYVIKYGGTFPDYPKLGDSRDFMLIGVNADGGRADVAWVGKPGGGQTCPAQGAVKSGIRTNLHDANGLQAFTPVPANEIDTVPTGWVVSASSSYEDLSVFKVTRQADGSALVQGTGRDVAVPGFDWPPPAPQKGTTNELDTLDARLTQAVGAVDPAHGGRFAIWAQHTVAGGGGSLVRWYEVDPAAPSLLQSGRVSSPSLYEFNGAISPDRVANGSNARAGNAMAMSFNTSSSSTFPAIRMVSKVGGAAQSSQALVKQSPGALGGYDCGDPKNFCRWGDYAAATPDPAPPAGQTRIWMVSEWALGQNAPGAQSRTQNFVVSP